MGRAKILLIEDHEQLFSTLLTVAKEEQFILVRQKSSADIPSLLDELNPQLIIIGSELEFKQQLEICCRMRRQTTVPIMIVKSPTCRRDELFEAGATDYVSQPVDFEELLLRIKAHLFHYRNVTTSRSFQLHFTNLVIDLIMQKVYYKGATIELSTQEFKLLSYLAYQPKQTFSSEQLFAHVWGISGHQDTRTVLVHISNLRKKLVTDHKIPPYIQTIRGVGYRIHDYYL
ncbi:response regulator transcription factor [Alkalicoccobacillus murimartini]|uniref:DNA-binding response OmpR family regulator n=1 Tax=Alkalicoccobacillus murimartini TaxID=171685 RepID=A0ABT9YGL5_9BACI|nr:response regulator transcription factor [Alkalicoccobacillus murimartini]MDQ0207006.1 DNA-binding response OmpR family regulator [Alkalicoccobacillus murimartini]